VNSTARYDHIGVGYSAHRRPEPSWSAAIVAALGPARSVVNVGAGTGSYEPADGLVIAVEPSSVMLSQRAPGAAPAVQGGAEALPFPDGRFDVALAILTVHHWTDPAAGLAELRRVARRQVVLTWDHDVASQFWLVRDYVPEIVEYDRRAPTLDAIRRHLAVTEVVPLPVPAACADGVMAAYWRRPDAYLDAGVRASISGLSLLESEINARFCAQLGSDLADGSWAARYSQLLDLDAFDAGYRLAVAAS
jgi:SAM-dependent methyltransferase